jgi:integrase
VALYKRGNVYWSYIYVDGVRHAKSTGTGNRKLAAEIDQRFKEELNLMRLGIAQPQPEMTFGALAARFLAEGNPKPYHLDRLKALLQYWSETPIGRITKAAAREYRAARHAQKVISDTTINRDLEALRHMLFWAVDEGLLLANPLSRVQMIRRRPTPRLVVSFEEEDKLLAAAAPHLRKIIIAALDTGMRRGEIFSQRWEHIDFARRILYVTHSKTVGGEARELPLTARLFTQLASDRLSDGLVFTYDGHAIGKIKTAWKAAIRRAKLRYFRFHDLRHTFNTRLMEAGISQDVRKVLMGHSTRGETNAIYTHVELPTKRGAIEKLERWTAEQRKALSQQEEVEHGRSFTSNRGDPARAVPDGRHPQPATAQSARRCRGPSQPSRAPWSPRRP